MLPDGRTTHVTATEYWSSYPITEVEQFEGEGTPMRLFPRNLGCLVFVLVFINLTLTH